MSDAEADKLDWILSTPDDADLADRYDRWAAEYDADHDAWGWDGPARAVERLLGHGRPDVVLDAGCGTGRVGRALVAAGWHGDLVGVDLSAGMLARAAVAANGYGRLLQASLTDLPLEDASVDAYVATGVYTHGHVGPEGFADAVRVVRPGGLIVLTVRDVVWRTLEAASTDHERAGSWTLLERTDPETFHPGKGDQGGQLQSVVTWRRR